MKHLNPKDSIYLVTDDDIDHFNTIVNENPHYSVLLRKNSGGLGFLWRLTFDIFYYLERPIEQQFMDSYKLLDNPLTSFIHQLLVRNEHLKYFKQVYNPDNGLKLLVSILLTKQILRHTNFFEIYEDLESNIDAYPLEEAQHLIDQTKPNLSDKHYQIQKQLLTNLRIKFSEHHYFDNIIQSTINEAKKLHNFILYSKVS